MDDLEITELCAYAIDAPLMGSNAPLYNPLKDDAQAMALVKKLNLHIHMRYRFMPKNEDDRDWIAETPHDGRDSRAVNDDLNRAICECVAKLIKKRSPK